MRKIILSALVCAVWAAPAVAKDTKHTVSPVPHSVPSPAPHADGQQRKPAATPSIEDALRTRLGRAGYKDIEMVPTSFLVRAKDADGNPVIIEVSPDSVTELKVAPQAGQDGTGAAPADEEKF